MSLLHQDNIIHNHERRRKNPNSRRQLEFCSGQGIMWHVRVYSELCYLEDSFECRSEVVVDSFLGIRARNATFLTVA